MSSSAAVNPMPGTPAMMNEVQNDRLLWAVLVAGAAHAIAALYAGSIEAPAQIERPPVEVELAFRAPPPPPAVAPEPERRAPEPPAPAAPKPVPIKAQPAEPPPAAKAGAVLTAAPDVAAPANAEPFDFTSDPSSTVYGAGVVAVGGTAAYGAPGARAGGTGARPAPQLASGDGLTAASDLSERPRLREADPCRGYFPKNALSDSAAVTVRVVIGKAGNVTATTLVTESPRGQGFGAAARTCMTEQRFTPALDRAGRPAATAVNVNVKFNR